MNRAMEEIRESLTLVLEKLESIEDKIVSQETDIRTYIKNHDIRSDLDERLILHIKSTHTSLELLRDEIDELHQVMIALFYEKK